MNFRADDGTVTLSGVALSFLGVGQCQSLHVGYVWAGCVPLACHGQNRASLPAAVCKAVLFSLWLHVWIIYRI